MKQDGKKKDAAENKSGDEQFPGYPHYSSKDDVFSKDNAGGKVDADVDNITRATHITQKDIQPKSKVEADAPPIAGEDLGIKEGTEADVTKDDLLGLEAIDREMNDEDELDEDGLDSINEEDDVDAQEKDWINDKTGSDLDVPEELDEDAEDNGDGDEENGDYSLGGDRHEDLEEDRDDDGQ